MKEFTKGSIPVGGPKEYQVDPLEYLALRVATCPADDSDSIEYLRVKVRLFLGDDALPSDWAAAFVERLVAMCQSAVGAPQLNAQYLLRALQASVPLACNAIDDVRARGAWTLTEEEFQRRAEATAEALSRRRQPAFFEMPSMRGERVYMAVGPHESAAREQTREPQITSGEASNVGVYEQVEGYAALRLMTDPDDQAALTDIAESLLRRGDTERAIRYYERLCRLQPNAAWCHAVYGEALAMTGQLEAALSSLDRALCLEPMRSVTLLNKAQVFIRLERYEDARVALLTATRIGIPAEQSQAFDMAFDMAMSLVAGALMAGTRDTTGELLTVASTLRPESAMPWLIRAAIADDTDDTVAAIGYLDAALAVDPDSADTLAMRASAAMKLGASEEAARYYEQSLAIDPNNGKRWNDLGSCLQRVGEHERARYCYERAVAEDPDDPMHWSNLGGAVLNLARSLDDLQTVTEYLNKALELDPERVSAIFGLAVVALYRGQSDQAISGFEQVLSRDPMHKQARALLAKCRSRTADREESR